MPLFGIFEQRNPNIDSLAWFLGISRQLDISLQKSAFESLKSKGLESFHDDSLRISLIKLYDQSYYGLEQQISYYNIVVRTQFRPLLEDLPGQLKVVDNHVYIYLTGFEKVKSEHKLQNILALLEFVERITAGRIQTVIEENQRVASLIELSLLR
jgi:hypothetical protein